MGLMGCGKFSVPLFIILAACSHSVAASDQKIYLGAGVGSSSYDSADGLFYAMGGGDKSNYDITDSAVAYQLHMGWELARYIAIEAAYSDFGQAESDYRWTDTVNGHDVLARSEQELSVTAISLALKGILPLGDSFQLFGKLGYGNWEAEASRDNTLLFDGAVDTRNAGTDHVDGSDLFYAVGAEYRLTQNIFLYGEYFAQAAEYEDAAGNTYDWFEASALSVGLRWQFGAGVFNRNGPESQYGNKNITACDEKYNEISGAICNR